jgi:glycosyltransferase involved in cell wall biosynthesis
MSIRNNCLPEFLNEHCVALTTEYVHTNDNHYGQQILLNSERSGLLRLLLLYIKKLRVVKKTDILISVSGTFISIFLIRYITMSTNMLVFDRNAQKKFPLKKRVRYWILELSQVLSFTFADGIIFLSAYNRDVVLTRYPWLKKKRVKVVPLGIEKRFIQSQIDPLRIESRKRFVYVSRVNHYKHHIEVAKAFIEMNRLGVDLQIDFYGGEGDYQLSKELFELISLNPGYMRWKGEVEYQKMHEIYSEYDAIIFASSCECFPNLLIEAMGSGLPILSSSHRPMKDILKDSGFYFIPENVPSIIESLNIFIKIPLQKLKDSCQKNIVEAKSYKWKTMTTSLLKFAKNEK